MSVNWSTLSVEGVEVLGSSFGKGNLGGGGRSIWKYAEYSTEHTFFSYEWMAHGSSAVCGSKKKDLSYHPPRSQRVIGICTLGYRRSADSPWIISQPSKDVEEFALQFPISFLSPNRILTSNRGGDILFFFFFLTSPSLSQKYSNSMPDITIATPLSHLVHHAFVPWRWA